jgi:hypothetical protein
MSFAGEWLGLSSPFYEELFIPSDMIHRKSIWVQAYDLDIIPGEYFNPYTVPVAYVILMLEALLDGRIVVE